MTAKNNLEVQLDTNAFIWHETTFLSQPIVNLYMLYKTIAGFLMSSFLTRPFQSSSWIEQISWAPGDPMSTPESSDEFFFRLDSSSRLIGRKKGKPSSMTSMTRFSLTRKETKKMFRTLLLKLVGSSVNLKRHTLPP
jgi:hypothetical protein